MIGFGAFVAMRNLEITSLQDDRLLLIDPTVEGFYDNVLHYETENRDILSYIEAIHEVKEAELAPFWRPIMDPSEHKGKIIYKKEQMPAVGHSYKWWEKTVSQMPPVERKKWFIGSEYQYYADEVDMINLLIAQGYSIDSAIEFFIFRESNIVIKKTGSSKTCDRYDLRNTSKILYCTNGNGCWLANGRFYNSWHLGRDNSSNIPLADLSYNDNLSQNFDTAVGYLVLK